MARPRRGDAALDRLPQGAGSVEEALGGDYSLSTRALCRLLQCSRGFVEDRLRPVVRHVYVTQRTRLADGRRPGGTWWSESDVAALLASGTVERRSVLVDARCGEPWLAALADSERARAAPGRMRLPGGLPLADGPVAALLRARRASHAWVALGDEPPGVGGMPGWRTPADLRDWGDTDEDVSRAAWDLGCLRLTLDVGGARRVYYAPPDGDVARLREAVSGGSGGRGGAGALLAVPADSVPPAALRRLLGPGE